MAAQDGDQLDQYFPLRAGSYWIYQGNVKWTHPKTQNVSEKILTWKMEVMEVITRDNVVIAVIKGHPQDLAWYQDGDQPGDYLIVHLDYQYYIIENERYFEVLNRVRDQGDSLEDLVREDELFLQSPLKATRAYGPQEYMGRSDLMYLWFVEKEEKAHLDKFKNLKFTGPHTEFRIIRRTLPDHTFIDFVPGVGITQYIYSHHGTVAETDMQLVEYSEG